MKNRFKVLVFVMLGILCVAVTSLNAGNDTNDSILVAKIEHLTKENETIKDDVEILSERFKQLDNSKFKKMLRPNKDIDFLWKSIGGYSSAKATLCLTECLGYSDLHVKNIEYTNVYNDVSITTLDYEIGYDKYGNFVISSDVGEILTCKDDTNCTVSLCQMEYIENFLHLKVGKDDSLKTRIIRAYHELNNDDWENDNIRFGILTQYLKQSEALATSISVNFYPSYRRYSEGDVDLLRRTSLFVAVGTASSFDSNTSISGAVYTVGLGIDIVKGVNIALSYNMYSFKNEKKDEFEKSLGIGITLTSDLWYAIMKK